jgi:hypothetical protein
MCIPDHARANFQTLLRAATDGNLALMECNHAVTGEPPTSFARSDATARISCSRRSAIAPMATPMTPICRRPKPHRIAPRPDPLIAS